MTLKDIADRLGISVSTVSRVVNQNDPKAASPQVQQKIWQVVRETGYIPNKAARSLKMGRQEESGAEAKAIACIFARSQDTVSDPFFTQLARSVEQEAFKNNYFVKHSFSALDMGVERMYRHIAQLQVEGVIILGRYSEDLMMFLSKHYRNVVYTGLNPIEAPFDQVICDGFEAATAAMEYLVRLGHTKIAYIGEKNQEIRYRAYRQCLKDHGLTPPQGGTVDMTQAFEGGYKGALKLLQQKADMTAVFCANDVTAIGAMKGFQESGLRIPEDLSLISIDDIDTAKYVSPMLTTIHIPLEELGRVAAQTLIRRIQKLHKLPMKISLPFYIAKRESCRKR